MDRLRSTIAKIDRTNNKKEVFTNIVASKVTKFSWQTKLRSVSRMLFSAEEFPWSNETSKNPEYFLAGP